MTTHELTAKAHTRLVNTLQARKNVLSIPHKKALFSLVESFMKMGAGTISGRWAFPIPTGCGKTTAIVECCAALHQVGNTATSAVVCASRIEALCTMKRDMLAAGIPANKIGLIYAGAKADKYSEPCTINNEDRQFLLISHNRVANAQHLPQLNTFHGGPRSVVVYDESLLVSEIEHFLVDQFNGALGKWIAKLALDIPTQPELANICNWMTERRAVIETAYHSFDQLGDNQLPSPCFTLSIDDQVEWQARFKHEGDSILAGFLTVQHLPLRLVRHNKTAAVSYQITIPPSLTNMLVLDASYPIRTLEHEDKTLQDAETLPICKTFQIKFDAFKRFDHVTLYRMTQHGGRSSVATHKVKMKKILLDTVKIIQDIPTEDEILVFVYKDWQQVSSAKMLETELDKVGIKPGQRIHIQTWGNETSVNTYHTCKHVILVGILHRDLTDLEAHHLGQVNDISKIVTTKTLKDLCLSERVHLAYQALSRGCCRVMGSEGQALPMTGYIIEAEAELETELSSVMPGVVWKPWKPVYSNAVAHGQFISDLHHRTIQALSSLAVDSIASKTFNAKVLHETKVPPQTWKIALRRALDESPQWIQRDQWIARRKPTGQFLYKEGKTAQDNLSIEQAA